MNRNDFYKTAQSLAILSLDRIIKDKKTLLKNDIFTYYSIDELTIFIVKAKEMQKKLIDQYKAIFGGKTNDIKAYAKNIEKDFGDLYELNKMYLHNTIFDYVRKEDPKNDIEYAKKWAAELKAKYVTE